MLEVLRHDWLHCSIVQAYVEFGKCMGSAWLERNTFDVLTHVFGLVSNPKTAQTHVDAVYARKCVQFIVRSLVGGILSDKAQITAAKDICRIIVKQMSIMGGCCLRMSARFAAVQCNAVFVCCWHLDAAEEGEKTSIDVHLSQHVLVSSLFELGCLVHSLGTSASPLVSEPSAGEVSVKQCVVQV